MDSILNWNTKFLWPFAETKGKQHFADISDIYLAGYFLAICMELKIYLRRDTWQSVAARVFRE